VYLGVLRENATRQRARDGNTQMNKIQLGLLSYSLEVSALTFVGRLEVRKDCKATVVRAKSLLGGPNKDMATGRLSILPDMRT
jgi:hypothetical protein